MLVCVIPLGLSQVRVDSTDCTHVGAFELARRAPSLRRRLLWRLGRRDGWRWRTLGDRRSGKWGGGAPLLLLHLLRDRLVPLRVQVQDLVANVCRTRDACERLACPFVFLFRGRRQRHLPGAPPERPEQTAPTSAVTTAWGSSPGCRTCKGDPPST